MSRNCDLNILFFVEQKSSSTKRELLKKNKKSSEAEKGHAFALIFA